MTPRVETVRVNLERLGALNWARRFARDRGAPLNECITPGCRDPRIMRARNALMCVLGDTLGLSDGEVSRALLIDRSWVNRARKARRAELAREYAR